MIQSDFFRHGVAVLAFLGLLIGWSQAGYFGMEILAEIAVFAILCMSLDLLAGYTGLVSLGHAALFGTGAYLFAFCTIKLGYPVFPSMALASLGTGVIALMVGAVVTRVQGIFFIMITLAIGEMGYEFFFKNRALGGDDGLAGIPRMDLSGAGLDLADPGIFALMLILLTAVIYVLLSRLMLSPYGAVLRGIHSNPERMRALGLPVRLYQTSVFALSGLIAGFAGTLTAQHTMFITPELLHWTTSGELLVMAILGGLGTLIGSIIGAAMVTLLRHELSNITDYWGLWLGFFLILTVLTGRNGLVGWLDAGRRAFMRRDSNSETRSMLRADNLQMSFGALAVTKNVSLDVPLGMRHAIIGPNGAGKTTLFNLLSGQLIPMSGQIHIGDVEVTKLSIDQRARLGLSRSFQKNNLFETETVAENFMLADIARQGYGYRFWQRLSSMGMAIEQAEATAAMVGLADDFTRPVRELAYGSRRQLEVGLALMTKPKILLLDEPTSGMSPEETERMLALIEGLPRDLAVLIIEHDMDLVFAYADRITVLNYGEILMEGSPDEVRGSAVVQETYLGGDLV